MLQEIIGAIKPMLRPYDVIIKYGGEEFIIILSKINVVKNEIVPEVESMKNAYAIGERIRKKVESLRIIPYGTDECVSVTISIGVALFSEAKDQYELIQNANDAEHAAKVESRNTTRLFYKGKIFENPEKMETGNE